jgi:hypothetical protein
MKLLLSNSSLKNLVLVGSALVVAAAIAMPSQARVMTAQEFIASVDEVKYVCRRLDQPFWELRRQYGCGEMVSCFKAGTCQFKIVKRKQRQPLTHAVLALSEGPDSNDHHHDGPDGGRGSKSKR